MPIWIFELDGRRCLTARRAACASGQAARPRACSFPMRPSAPAGPSALAARQLPGSRRRSGARRPICTWWSIHAVAARRPRATGSVFGMNSRATRRAGELAAADPVHRARLGRRLELAARSRPELFSCGAPFGHELETAITHGVFPGRGGIRCAVGRLCDAPYRGKSPPRPPRSRALRSSKKSQGA